jgi:hypothetical protein
MILKHLLLAVDAEAGAVQKQMQAKLTKPFITEWFEKNKEANNPEAKSDAFHVPVGGNGKPDGRYMTPNPAWDAVLKKTFYGTGTTTEPMMFGAQRLHQYLLKTKPALEISRRYIERWRSEQQVSQLHRQWNSDGLNVRRMPHGPGNVCQLDIKNMESKEFGGWKYILSVYDMWSKMLFVESMKDRTAGPQGSVIKAVRKIIARAAAKGMKIRGIQADNEFRSDALVALLESKDVKLWHALPYQPTSQGGVERSNAVVARAIGMRSMQQDKANWPSALQGLIANYNKGWQSAIKTSPDEALKSWKDDDQAEISDVQQHLYKGKTDKKNDIDRPKYQVGDKVQLRIALEKAGGLAWTRAFFTVDKAMMEKQRGSGNGPRQQLVVTYRVKDASGEVHPNVMYNDNLQRYVVPKSKVKQPELFLIQYLLRAVVPKQGPLKDQPCYVVKWIGYAAADYVLRSDLETDVPKLVKKFDAKYNVVWRQNAAGKWSVTSDRD